MTAFFSETVPQQKDTEATQSVVDGGQLGATDSRQHVSPYFGAPLPPSEEVPVPSRLVLSPAFLRSPGSICVRSLLSN